MSKSMEHTCLETTRRSPVPLGFARNFDITRECIQVQKSLYHYVLFYNNYFRDIFNIEDASINFPRNSFVATVNIC